MKLIMFLSFFILFVLYSCNQNKFNNQVRVEDTYKKVFTINDLVELSKSKFGFVNIDKTINEYYGDFDCTSKEKYFFDFNYG